MRTAKPNDRTGTLRARAALSRRICLGVMVTLVAALLSAEFVLRVFFDARLREHAYPAIYESDPTRGYRYKPRSTGRLCTADICRNVMVNAQGFVGPDFSPQKPPGIFRIIVIASSNGTGIWTDGDSFVTLMQRFMSTQSKRIEVLNLSSDGMLRSRENALIARDVAVKFAPDLVLLETTLPFVTNGSVGREVYRGYVIAFPSDHAGGMQSARSTIDYIERHSVLSGLYRRSYVARAVAEYYSTHSSTNIARLVRAFIQRDYDIVTRPVAHSYLESIRDLLQVHAALAAVGARLVLLSTDADTAVERAARDTQLDRISYPFPVGRTYRFEHDQHLNQNGHTWIAEHIRQAVLRLVPPAYLDTQVTQLP